MVLRVKGLKPKTVVTVTEGEVILKKPLGCQSTTVQNREAPKARQAEPDNYFFARASKLRAGEIHHKGDITFLSHRKVLQEYRIIA